MIQLGNCLDYLQILPNNFVDAIITDPPYGLSFMGKKWDYDVPSVEIWEECERVLKPGGYLLSFSGTRTYHRMAVRIEDAGFEIRDMVAWVYGSGFPKSRNIGKDVDKIQGNTREVTGTIAAPGFAKTEVEMGKQNRNVYEFETSKDSSEWEGWGTALKPAFEPIVVARKVFSEKTVAENVLKWGTGGINIDECRIQGEPIPINKLEEWSGFGEKVQPKYEQSINTSGRFPANFIHDGSDEVLDLFPDKAGARSPVMSGQRGFGGEIYNSYKSSGDDGKSFHGDELSNAARFFYCAKVSKKERNLGCDLLEEHQIVTFATANGTSGKPSSISEGRDTKYRNNHPTVKPVAVMEYLIKLVSRKGSLIVDPFAGSGSTGIACVNLDRHFIGYEMDEGYYNIAQARIEYAKRMKMIEKCKEDENDREM